MKASKITYKSQLGIQVMNPFSFSQTVYKSDPIVRYISEFIPRRLWRVPKWLLACCLTIAVFAGIIYLPLMWAHHDPSGGVLTGFLIAMMLIAMGQVLFMVTMIVQPFNWWNRRAIYE